MVPERKSNGNFMMDRDIHGESNIWSKAQRQKKINRSDVNVGFELNHRSVGYSKQCSLVLSCVEDTGRSCLLKGIGF